MTAYQPETDIGFPDTALAVKLTWMLLAAFLLAGEHSCLMVIFISRAATAVCFPGYSRAEYLHPNDVCLSDFCVLDLGIDRVGFHPIQTNQSNEQPASILWFSVRERCYRKGQAI